MQVNKWKKLAHLVKIIFASFVGCIGYAMMRIVTTYVFDLKLYD